MSKEDSSKNKAVKPNIKLKPKLKCDICNCSFNKEVKLRKHISNKHEQKIYTSDNEIGQGQFGLIYDFLFVLSLLFI